MAEHVAKLWSDFDGTAVRKYSWRRPRNWRKYPLPGIEHYVDFMLGVQQSGVELAGTVSIRKERFRKEVTNRSIRELGYTGIINPEKVVYAGNEEAKGRFLAEQAEATTIGVVDDKPHKVGAAMLSALIEPWQRFETAHNPILLGVVSHRRSQEYIERLADQAKAMSRDLDVGEFGAETTTGLWIRAGGASLHVVQLQPYSEATGQEFGNMLLELVAA